MGRLRWLMILALVVLPIVGCSSPNPVTPSPVATVSPTPAPTASPSADLTALASHYKTLATKTTAARVRCTITADAAAANLTSARAAAQGCLDDFSGVVAEFKAINWGPVQPQADSVIAAITTLDTLTGEMASAASVEAFRAASDQLSSAEVTLLSAASRLRTALGLPAL